jgi:hypothetical protein
MRPITLLVPSSAQLSEDVLRDVLDVARQQTGLNLTAARLSSPALLPQIFERSPGVIAWAPSSVAFVLERMHLAASLLTVVAPGAGLRSAVLVARLGVEGLADLAGRRVAWVSRFSTTGYDLPRLYLESFGVEPDGLFGGQRFCGSHLAVAGALARGEVDVGALHSRALRHVFDRMAARVLVSIGPVPADVVVAGPGVPAAICEGLVRGLHSTRVGPLHFGYARDGHLDLFGMLHRHASTLEDRSLPARAETVAVPLH